MAGADWEAHNRQGDDALEWENEQIGTFPDVEVAQTAALVIAGKDPQLEAAVAGEHDPLQSTLSPGCVFTRTVLCCSGAGGAGGEPTAAGARAASAAARPLAAVRAWTCNKLRCKSLRDQSR